MIVTTIHLTIHGLVQGVGYRAWTVEQARKRGLTGWVRNRRDGTVEAVFVGPKAAVTDMVAQCKIGPEIARVFDIQSTGWIGATPTDFKQLPTV